MGERDFLRSPGDDGRRAVIGSPAWKRLAVTLKNFQQGKTDHEWPQAAQILQDDMPDHAFLPRAARAKVVNMALSATG